MNEKHGLWQVGTEYVNCVCRSGAIPVLIPPCDEQKIDELLDRLDGIVLTGGGDIDPHLYGDSDISPKTVSVVRDYDLFEIALTRKAYDLDVPVLGICRGMQIMNVAFGGSLYQDILDCDLAKKSHTQEKPYENLAHSVTIEPDSLLARLLTDTHVDTRISVNSIHHQAIRNLASNLAVSARSDTGIVEAIESPHKTFFLGVQWHPEYLENGQFLFDRLSKSSSVHPY